MVEKFNMADFLHKNSWFFGSGTMDEIFEFLDMLYFEHCSIVKNLKFKMAAIFKMASKMFIFFTQYFQKWYFCQFFFCLFTFGKNVTFMDIIFLEYSKWKKKSIWNFKFSNKFQDFIIAQLLNEMFSIFDML
jgi:hypothetical protein